MNHQDAMKVGKCPECGDGALHHGPWTDEQIHEVSADMGMQDADFYDTCDQCFIDMVGCGDLAYAEKLAGRKLCPAIPVHPEGQVACVTGVTPCTPITNNDETTT